MPLAVRLPQHERRQLRVAVHTALRNGLVVGADQKKKAGRLTMRRRGMRARAAASRATKLLESVVLTTVIPRLGGEKKGKKYLSSPRVVLRLIPTQRFDF